MKAKFFSFLLSAALLPVPVLAASVPLWSALDDVVKYAPKTLPDAPLLLKAVKNDARLLEEGASFKFNMSLDAAPVKTSKETVYRTSALMALPSGDLFFRKFEIRVSGKPRAVRAVKILEDIPLKQMHFELSAGLIDRMLVVEDVANRIAMVFPIGVGGIDDNITGNGRRILTPLYHRATIEIDNIIDHRAKPAYYRNQPFIPITNARGVRTPIAFHVTILDDDVWEAKGGGYLVRGFDSHGCMRLRLRDLTQLYTILKGQPDSRVPVTVEYFVWKRNDDGVRDRAQGQIQEIHPYPMRRKSYLGVTNFGTEKNPQAKRDPKEHLLIMGRVHQPPPLSELRDFSADDVTDLVEFDGLSRDLNPTEGFVGIGFRPL